MATNSNRDSLSGFGRNLRHWRKIRNLTQIELAAMAGTTSRYISFIETGRSNPGEQMIVRLAEALEVPIRDRNDLLASAGFPGLYPRYHLSDKVMAPFRQAVRYTLDSHHPFPAFAINRTYDLVEINPAAEALFFGDSDRKPGNIIEQLFQPGYYRNFIDNWYDVASELLRRLRRDVIELPGDDRLNDLLLYAEQQLEEAEPQILEGAPKLIICPNYRVENSIIHTISMAATFMSVRESTLEEIRIETIFPRDKEAEEFLLKLASCSH